MTRGGSVRAIFDDSVSSIYELEVEGERNCVKLVTTNTIDDDCLAIRLDKKSTVGLIQVLTECLFEMDQCGEASDGEVVSITPYLVMDDSNDTVCFISCGEEDDWYEDEWD